MSPATKGVIRREPFVLLLLALGVLVWSGISPKDRFTWFLEVLPVLIGVPILVATHRRFPLTPLRSGGWLFTLVTAICLAVSALYELFEWGMAVATGSAADAFLGTQGDPWDTQWDMFFCFVGALTSQLLLTRAHDRELASLGSPAAA